MSKKIKDLSSPIESTGEVPTENIPDTKAIVSTASSITAISLPENHPGRKYLTILPPMYHKDLLKLREPTIEDFVETVNDMTATKALTSQELEGFNKWLLGNTQTRSGDYREVGNFEIPELRIDQGTGDSGKRPAGSKKGYVFDSNMHTILAPNAQEAKMSFSVERFTGIVLGIFPGRLMWPPKDDNGNVVALPGQTAANAKMPLCYSRDRKIGSKFGACNVCGNRQWSTGTYRKNECKDEVHMYVVRYDTDSTKILPLSQIFKINMTSTSINTGYKPFDQQSKEWSVLWEKLIVFEVMSQTKGTNTFYSWKTSLSISPQYPQGDIVPPRLYPLLSLISANIVSAIFFPGLAQIYGKTPEALSIGKTADSTDGAEALAHANDMAGNV
jgi:hypothetical protein